MKSKCLTAICAIGLLMGAVMNAQAKSAALSTFLWTNRVLVVIAPGPQDANLLAQRRIYHEAAAAMAERDVVLVEAVGDDGHARAMRAQLSAGRSGFTVLLVGKDGNTAFAADKPLAADAIFKRIDAMPMRQDEMRRKR
jgi:uridylate kinase